MELPAPSLPRLGAPESGWRVAAYVAGGVAVVELIALLVIGLAFVAKPFAGDEKEPAQAVSAQVAGEDATKGAKATMPETQPAIAEIARSRTPVLVLNGNGISGSAAAKAAAVKQLRYPVVGVGDAQRRNFPHTIVMYRPGFLGEAQRLAKDMGLDRARAVPLDGMRAPELDGARLVLVVGDSA